ncbi:ABC transporter ATP-binding protein [Natrononativus amylolyticus]|uniref:ABC transporter ATP-binding protein n=1 Tax=Natrononativus amylolyticus TaxID=2963434 RepID=UPI0020CF53DE|nr:ABC transporter ATP-binding protein [Natrononativus amylolyticus]
MTTEPLLSVRSLHTHFHVNETVRAVDGVSFDVNAGETVCIVGESGSGKTVTGESITRLFASPPGEIPEGSIRFKGREVTEMDDTELRELRGGHISHIFQNPQGALNPVYTIGWQIMEAITLHQDVSKEEAREQAISLLDRVGIPEPVERLRQYPHEFSGGMKQRVIIAIALACQPDLLIADEPTTALDVTIQAQIISLLNDLQEEFGIGIIFITHDLGVVAEIADRVIVMYAGKIMERGDVMDIFKEPAHPYTRALFDCLPESGSLGGIPGTLPDPTAIPPGCRFAVRCEYDVDECWSGDQPAFESATGTDHEVSCLHYRTGSDQSVLASVGSTNTDESALANGGDHNDAE